MKLIPDFPNVAPSLVLAFVAYFAAALVEASGDARQHANFMNINSIHEATNQLLLCLAIRPSLADKNSYFCVSKDYHLGAGI